MNLYGIFDIYQHKVKYLKIEENKEMALYSLVAFAFPFLLQQPQILLGSVVNTTLAMSAFYLKGRRVLPLVFLPSIGALAQGFLFGPLTGYLVYMLPFIWLGNAVMIGAVKLLFVKLKSNYAFSAASAVVLKTGLLFAAAYLLFNFGIVPAEFIYFFSIMQIFTATIGCAAAYGIDVGRKNM